MKTSVSLLILLMLLHPAFSQTNYQKQIDSLKNVLANAPADISKVNAMVSILAIYERYKPGEGLTYKDSALKMANRMNRKIYIARVNDKVGRLYWRTGKFSEAYKYHFTALKLYNEVGDKLARNNVLVEIGQDYLNDTKFDEAHTYLLKALELSEQTNDKQNIANTYDKLIALYENQGNFAEASKAAFVNLKICEELGDKKGMAYAALNVASNFQTQGNNAEALKYFKQSLQLARETNDELCEAYSYRAIGDIYSGMRNFDEAENNYKKGLKVANEMENSWIVLAVLYRGIGNMYRAEGKFNEALKYFLITANELKAIASNHALASLYSEIGIVYTHLNKYELARKYFDSSNALCKKLNTKVTFEDYYAGRQLLDSATGNWKDAYEHYKQYTSVKDSTFNKETLRKMVTSQMQYENDKKEAIAKSEQEKKDIITQAEIIHQRNIRNFALGILGVLLLFSIVVFVQRNKVAREKKRSDKLVTDKELLLREIHHRVKNNLEVVSSLLALQSSQIDDLNTKEAMREGQNRVHSIGIVHQKLYLGENLGAIEMKDYFINLGESILDSFGAEGRVNVELAMEKLNVDIDTAVPLGLIVNELIMNTLKYAFLGSQHGSICIKLEKQTGGILHLEVSDNGIGKSGITQGTGFGGQLISLLTRQLNGTMKEENKNGTRIIFDFKLYKVA